MHWLVILLTSSAVALIGIGIYLELRRRRGRFAGRPWHRHAVLANLILFALTLLATLTVGTHEALAQGAAAGAQGEISLGMGLALIGVGIPTALATIGAGLAVGTVGAAALALIAEKPEAFGRTLVYLGLAEGIAIYGLVVSILMLGKI